MLEKQLILPEESVRPKSGVGAGIKFERLKQRYLALRAQRSTEQEVRELIDDITAAQDDPDITKEIASSLNFFLNSLELLLPSRGKSK